MEQVGLTPSDTGLPGGKKTGQRITHYILPNGAFEQAAQELLISGFKLSWQSPTSGAQREKKQTRTKYSCGGCGLSAWAKPDAHLVCGNCAQTLEASTPTTRAGAKQQGYSKPCRASDV